jgi:hypothetical protein
MRSELTHNSRSTSLLNEIISGITLYFDKALGNNLLYRFERAQYVEQTRRYGGGPGGAAAAATTSGSSSAPATGSTQGPASMGAGAGAGEKRAMSEIYGAEHLLRLFGMSCRARLTGLDGIYCLWVC